MLKEKTEFKPFRQFNPVDPAWTGITYKELAKPQGLTEDQVAEVSQSISYVPSLGVGTSSPTSPLEVASQTAPQFTIRYDATNAVTFGCDANGDLTITPTGTDVFISNLNLTVGSLTPGRVTFAGTGGLLVDDADLTFATDTLTAKNVVVPTNLTLSNLTASRLAQTDGSKIAASVTDLTTYIAGTANQVTVTNDGDGTVTLAAPQNLHTSATPTFAKLTTTDDVIVDDSANGLVLKDAAGTPHYWRLSVSTLGVLSTADLGTSPP